MTKEDDVDFSIDPNKLDYEAVRQEKMIGKYSRLWAKAKYNAETIESELDVVKADLFLKIKKRPEKYDLDSTTVEALKAAVTINEKTQECNARFLQAKYEQDILKGVLNRLEHRKQMIQELVTVTGREYYGYPKIPKEGGDKFKERLKRKARTKTED